MLFKLSRCFIIPLSRYHIKFNPSPSVSTSLTYMSIRGDEAIHLKYTPWQRYITKDATRKILTSSFNSDSSAPSTECVWLLVWSLTRLFRGLKLLSVTLFSRKYRVRRVIVILQSLFMNWEMGRQKHHFLIITINAKNAPTNSACSWLPQKAKASGLDSSSQTLTEESKNEQQKTTHGRHPTYWWGAVIRRNPIPNSYSKYRRLVNSNK